MSRVKTEYICINKDGCNGVDGTSKDTRAGSSSGRRF